MAGSRADFEDDLVEKAERAKPESSMCGPSRKVNVQELQPPASRSDFLSSKLTQIEKLRAELLQEKHLRFIQYPN